MSFKENFCPSPWLHLHINNAGNFEYCRWANKNERSIGSNIRDVSPVAFFQEKMAPLRKSMLAGEKISGCSECVIMEQHKKISGRARQLLKIGVTIEEFEKTMLSSPWLPKFSESAENQGLTDQYPQDWQIDLGNFCNSACVFCHPFSSSRLASEFKKVGFSDKLPAKAWCDDPVLLSRFMDVLVASPHIAYLHFIGGETLITPAFATILQGLIDNHLADKISIGFTTNLTVWDESIVSKLRQFREVNLGMSVECFHPLNDYLRYGSKLTQTYALLDSWQETARNHGWSLQLRVTPTLLSISYLDTVYDYALDQQIPVESCNFLDSPAFLRPSVLPENYRQRAADRLRKIVAQDPECGSDRVYNIRDQNKARSQIIQDAQSYINYLESSPDESHRLPDLIKYLKVLEKNRNNSVLDYIPEYADLFRSFGY